VPHCIQIKKKLRRKGQRDNVKKENFFSLHHFAIFGAAFLRKLLHYLYFALKKWSRCPANNWPDIWFTRTIFKVYLAKILRQKSMQQGWLGDHPYAQSDKNFWVGSRGSKTPTSPSRETGKPVQSDEGVYRPTLCSSTPES